MALGGAFRPRFRHFRERNGARGVHAERDDREPTEPDDHPEDGREDRRDHGEKTIHGPRPCNVLTRVPRELGDRLEPDWHEGSEAQARSEEHTSELQSPY